MYLSERLMNLAVYFENDDFYVLVPIPSDKGYMLYRPVAGIGAGRARAPPIISKKLHFFH